MITNRRARAVASAGAASIIAVLALTGCGRDDAADTPSDAPTAVAEGKAEGTITVWAMGAEGEELDAIAEGFMAENPMPRSR